LFGMIGVGKVLLGSFYFGGVCIIISLISGILVYRRMRDEFNQEL